MVRTGAARAAVMLAAAVLAGCGGGGEPGGGSASSGAGAPSAASMPTAGASASDTAGATSTGGAGAAGQGVPERAAPAGEPPEDEGSAGGTPGDGGGGLDAPADDPFAGAVVLAEPMEFTTPSGNISCALDLGYARCDIVERDWEPPPPPEDCEVDFGQGVEVDDYGASLVCAGDTVLGAAQTLPYGEAVQGGRIACVSQRAGVRCEHLDTGAGFVLSRTSYDLY